MASYQIVLRDPVTGNQLDVITHFTRLEYSRQENQVGVMYLELPRCKAEAYFRKDLLLEIWRTVGGRTYLEGNTAWLLRAWTLSTSGSLKTWSLTALDMNFVLGGFEVEYAAESAQAKKSVTAIDNLMKAIVRENLGSLATDTARSLASFISVQADLTKAPTTTKAFARRIVLTVLQELAVESYQRGTYLVFDTQYVGAGVFEFRTFTGQLGVDRSRASGQAIVINEFRGSLVNAQLSYDYTNEVTVCVAGGTGQKSDRITASQSDTARLSESPYSRREVFQNAVQSGADAAALAAEARARLQEGRPVKTITGSIQDTSGLQYGVDYNFGDIVVGEYENISFDAHVDTIHVTVSRDGEIIDNRIRGVL
jgi:hypothetical protein